MRVIGKIFKWFFITLFTFLVIGILTAFIFGSMFFSYVKNSILTSDEVILNLETMPVNLSSTIYYKDPETGAYVEWVTLQNTENREWVPNEDIPNLFKNAFISIEDQRFREHPGVDIKRTAAACLNILTGKNVFGGSTITQQLIKNLTNDRDVTVKRKVTEICRAIMLEQRYSKDEILEWYMNIIYFGHGRYGIGAAAEYYYGKTVPELSLAEMCSIAGITNNPSKYDPYAYPDNNLQRRKLILDKMVELGYISTWEAEKAKEEVLTLAEHTSQERSGTVVYPYYVDAVIEDVIQYFQDSSGVSEQQATNMLYYGGYEIYTCVNMNIQKKMDAVYQDPANIPQTKDGRNLQSSMVVTDPYTGDIVGLEGGVGEKNVARGLNWATSSLGRRPPGSSIKPIAVYAPAIDHELVSPNTYLLDSDYVELDGTDWLPKNDGGQTNGWVTIRQGVVKSLNIISAQVLDKLTPAVSYQFLTDDLQMNLETADCDYSPLATGQLTIGTTAREMASAYTIFPSGGSFRKGRTFSLIKDSNGETVFENNASPTPAITEKTAYWMTDILQDAVKNGTGRGARLSSMPCAGKTGTTTDAKDRWFVGYTPYYVGAVWTGFSHPAKINISGNPAANVWKQVMESIHKDLPYKEFSVPEDTELPPETGYNPYSEEPEEEEPELPPEDEYFPGLEWDDGGEENQSTDWYLPWLDPQEEDGVWVDQNPVEDPSAGFFWDEPLLPEEDPSWAEAPEWVESSWGEE